MLYFLLLSCFLACTNGVTIYINAETGNDSACSISTTNGTPCRSLSHAYNITRGMSNMTLLIQNSYVILNGHVLSFVGQKHIFISGLSLSKRDGELSSTIQCEGNSGLYFEACDEVHLSHLNISKCMFNNSGFRSAIIFNTSSTIQVLNVTLYNSSSTGMMLVNCYEKVNLNFVNFINNGHKISSCPFKSGGLSIEVTETIPSIQYQLTSCNFYNNMVYKHGCAENESYTSPILWGISRRGGGMGINIAGASSNNTIILDSCNFFYNSAKWGGGLHIQFQDSTKNNTILISHTVFAMNRALRVSGGLNINLLNDGDTPLTNKILVTHSLFQANNAKSGGGVGIALAFGNSPYFSEDNIMFDNCTWDSNSGTVLGSALDIGPYSSSSPNQHGFLPKPLFKDVRIINNYVFNKKEKGLLKTRHKNSGVFLVTRMEVNFSGNVLFQNNSPSALKAISSGITVDRFTTVKFLNNSGTNGGAICLTGFSHIILSSNTKLVFRYNSASDFGGGIYYSTIDQHDLFNSYSCFLRGESKVPQNVSLEFEGNNAKRGKWIYADSFLSCVNYCHTLKNKYKLIYIENITKCIGNVTGSREENIFSTSAQNFRLEKVKDTYNAIPGSQVNIPFHLTDELNQNVTSLLSATHTASNTTFQQQFMLDGTLSPLGQSNDKMVVDISVSGIRSIYFQFNLTTLPCPPGFTLDSVTGKCECGRYKAIVHCNMTEYRAYMDRVYWAGYIPHDSNNLYFAPCFPPICSLYTKYLHTNRAKLNEDICGPHRSGIMCGNCSANTTVHFHSRRYLCKTTQYCHWGPLFYLMSEIIPVVILFSAVVTFDLSFTSGNMVGFIFFSQYLEGLTIHTPIQELKLLQAPFVIYYGIFNMKYFTVELLSFCLWKNLDTLDIIALKYLTVLFAFSLVVLLIFLLQSGRCTIISKYRSHFSKKQSYTHGLSAFLVMCYIECTKTSFQLLQFAKPIGLHHQRAETYTYYGGLPYLRGKHLAYGVIAMLSITFITILPPVILLVHPLLLQVLSLCNLSEHWLVHKSLKCLFFHKMIPFLDCFQSCYKDQYRFFSGLYYIYRVVILLCFLTAKSYIQLLVYLQCLLLVFLGIHSTIQPYKTKLHNILDSLMFLNLSLINILNILDYYSKKNDLSSNFNSYDQFALAVQVILLYLPMIISIAYIIRKLHCFIKNCAIPTSGQYERLSTEEIDDSRGGGDHMTTSYQETAAASETRLISYS